MLKKKVAKSHHSNRKDLLLCLDDLSMCDDDDPGSSADWIRAVDRGSLIHINNMTFELFLSMEQSIRRCVKAGQELEDYSYVFSLKMLSYAKVRNMMIAFSLPLVSLLKPVSSSRLDKFNHIHAERRLNIAFKGMNIAFPIPFRKVLNLCSS